MKYGEDLPKVSVIVLTYNQVEFVEIAIQSVLEQDYPNIELVVSDDASTDGSREKIVAFKDATDRGFIALTGEQNVGITANNNRALAACTGTYVAFLGGDDVMLPGKIRKQVEWLEMDSSRTLCYHDLDVFDSDSDKTLYLWSDRYSMRSGDARSILKFGTYFGASSVVLRMPSKRQIFFDDRIPISSDWLFWIEAVAAHNGSVGAIPDVLARYRRHSVNITSQVAYRLNEALVSLDIVEQKFPAFRFLCRQKRGEAYLLAGLASWRQRKVPMAFARLLQSLRACNGLWIGPAMLILNKALRRKM